MDNTFFERMALHNNSLSRKINHNSDLLMDKLFSNDGNYKKGHIYDSNNDFLDNVDFKFQYAYSFSAMSNDKVEFYAQFRPYYHPEIKYKNSDGIERLGFYLDIPNDLGIFEKWLILGRNETKTFTRYNILKCNWTFKWVYGGHVYSALGCLRNRNNYTAGIWSDNFTTTVQNEALFIIPSNSKTKTIDFDMRFMLTDNEINPKVYKVTKIEDTFPLGTVKITLTQDHYNKATDNVDSMICDFYSDSIIPIIDEPESAGIVINYSGASPTLHRSGSPRIISVTYEDGGEIDFDPEWKFCLNHEEVEEEDLTDFVISYNDDNTLAISAKQSAQVGAIVTIICTYDDGGYYYALELEVKP